jgi:hypothetical protein
LEYKNVVDGTAKKENQTVRKYTLLSTRWSKGRHSNLLSSIKTLSDGIKRTENGRHADHCSQNKRSSVLFGRCCVFSFRNVKADFNVPAVFENAGAGANAVVDRAAMAATRRVRRTDNRTMVNRDVM